MTTLSERVAWPQTNAQGAMVRTGMAVLFMGLGIPWQATINTDDDRIILSDRTSANPSPWLRNPTSSSVETTASAILEIRRLSGLTWAELADLFGVTRRSVHHWSSGKPVNAAHDQEIRKVLAIVRVLDRGSSAQTRNLLLDPDLQGVSILDLLKARNFGRATARAAFQPSYVRPKLTSLAPMEQRRPKPAPPALLVDALQDRPRITEKAKPNLSFRLPRPAKKSQG